MTVPVILQELVELNNPSVMEALRSLDFVACAGGALKESVGNMLAAAGVNVLNSYGNTEAGPLSVMYVPPEGYDWRWFMLRDDMGIQMIAEENEACADPNTCRLSVRPPGWTHIFEMQDLFAIDPSDGTKRRLRPLARTDDVIVLKNGEKVSPYTVESILAQRDDVRAAVVFGSGQSQLGVLIEPAQTVLSKQDLDEFRDNILRYLVEARTSIDAHAHIVFREAVVVLKEGQTLFRSDKGALLRRACYETYSQEIGQAYDQLSIGTVDVDGEILRGDVEDNIEKLIRTKILRSGQPTELTRSTDLFELGIDSLQVGQLHRILLSSLSLELGDRHAAERVVPDGFVYLNSTISKMARGLRGESRADDLSSSKEETIQKYIREHEVTPRLAGEQQPRKGAVVLLTGASGGLGSHVLRELVTNDSVEQVICLNRAAPGYADAYTRQYICSSEKGADIPPQFRKKIAILNTKTSDIHLGLQDFIYASLVATVTHVVHNAWPMDLNRQLHSFQPQFQIMSNLLRFCLEAKEWHLNREGFTVRLLFVSSISVVGFYNGKDKSSIEDTGTYHNSSTFLIPEDAPIEALHTLRVGYAEAKLVCERLVRNATNAGIIDGVITRMGQIAGALENGYWNSAEHIPMMMSLSARMGALPKLEGVSHSVDQSVVIKQQLLWQSAFATFFLSSYLREAEMAN
jgi:thioester reductase-like protein